MCESVTTVCPSNFVLSVCIKQLYCTSGLWIIISHPVFTDIICVKVTWIGVFITVKETAFTQAAGGAVSDGPPHQHKALKL